METSNFFVVADAALECCFWAAHERIKEGHIVKGTHWNKGTAFTYKQLLEVAGAKATSKDLHWPMTLSIRPLGAKNYRHRSAAANKRRLEMKASKGYGPWAARARRTSSRSGRPSGWETSGWSGSASSSSGAWWQRDPWWSSSAWGSQWRDDEQAQARDP